MARFVFVVAMMVCVGLAKAAEGEVDPAANIQALIQGMMAKITELMGQMNSAANCPKVCGDACQLEAEACIDIPDVMDCAAQSAACNAACDEMCGCLAACSESCGACPSDGDLMAMIQCTMKSVTCMGPCEAQCAAGEVTKESQAALSKASDEASKVMGSLMAMMPQPGAQ